MGSDKPTTFNGAADDADQTWGDWVLEGMYSTANGVHDNLPESWQKASKEYGITGTTQKLLKGKPIEAAIEFAGGDLMTKYGYAGGLTFLYMTMWRGSSLPMATMVSAAVSGLFGTLVDPYLKSFFNKAANPDATPDAQLNQDDDQPTGMEP